MGTPLTGAGDDTAHGFTSKGHLNGAGTATIGPFTGLPSGLPIYSVVLNIPPGSVPTTQSLPFVYFIP